MEEGSLRCDANVSLRPAGSDELGTKTELKNMNSFRFLERGVEAEIARQAAILDGGGRVEQETLHFDPRTGALTPLRSKEYSHDYRYFPEPDLVPLAPTAEMIEAARGGAARAARPSAASATRPSSAWARSRRPSSPSTPSSAPTSSAVLAAADGARARRSSPTGSPASSPRPARGRRRRTQRPDPSDLARD